jgi:hypothetical protein
MSQYPLAPFTFIKHLKCQINYENNKDDSKQLSIFTYSFSKYVPWVYYVVHPLVGTFVHKSLASWSL